MFYVGEEGEPAVEALRLSDAYAGEGDVEVVATVINVCSEKNADLLKECEALSGYVRLVRLVRRNRSRGLPVDAAVNSAVQQCIDEGVLAEYLRRRRSNVVDMFMDEYDEDVTANLRITRWTKVGNRFSKGGFTVSTNVVSPISPIW